MKRTLFIIAAASLLMVSCSKKNCCTCSCGCGACQCCTDTTAKAGVPEFAIVENEQTELPAADADGYITLFDGKTLQGWRGYGMTEAPASWNVEDGAIHLKGSGTGEAQVEGGGV